MFIFIINKYAYFINISIYKNIFGQLILQNKPKISIDPHLLKYKIYICFRWNEAKTEQNNDDRNKIHKF